MNALPYPDIDPVAFSIGPFDIRWYALAYMAGFLLGWRYALSVVGRMGYDKPSRSDIDDFLLWMVLGVILGGRIGYVLFYNFGYYLDNPLQALQLWHGGMSFHGGLIGSVIAILVYAWRRDIPVLRMADVIACVVPIGLFFGRIANFINAELVGRPSTMPWAVDFPNGGGVPRHPSQLYEAGLEGLVLFIIMVIASRSGYARRNDGFLTGLFLILYGLMRGFVEVFRSPDPQIGFILGMFTMGQLLSLPMIVLGGYLLFRHKRVAA